MDEFTEEVLPPIIVLLVAWALLSLPGDDPQHQVSTVKPDSLARPVAVDTTFHKSAVVVVQWRN